MSDEVESELADLDAFEKVLAELAREKSEIEALLARDLKSDLANINAGIEAVEAAIARLRARPAFPYSRAKSLPELSIACLKSAEESWLSPREIADRLFELGLITNKPGFVGHISTALHNRMKSPSRNNGLEFEEGRFRYRATNEDA